MRSWRAWDSIARVSSSASSPYGGGVSDLDCQCVRMIDRAKRAGSREPEGLKLVLKSGRIEGCGVQ